MSLDNSLINDNQRFILFIFILLGLYLFVLDAVNASARVVTFVWTANPETVESYKIYYKTGSSGEPYNGTGAEEGSSPVVTGNVQTYTLHDLSDTETYYFALTAYLGAEESNYSDEIVLSPGSAPSLISVEEIK